MSTERRGRPKKTEQEITNASLPTIMAADYSAMVKSYSVEDKTNKNTKVEVLKTQKYGSGPVVMVFKTSNRSNAQTKMKVWTTYNIDYILTAPKIPGLPEKAEVLELGVGEVFIEKYKKQYNLK